MKYAIIAAGEGSRLANEGVTHPKPLVPLAGVPLVERLIKIFARLDAESISIIINEQQPETYRLLCELQKQYPINIVVKSTPSSMHSLHALAQHLRGGKFCLTTVDTIFDESEFATYISEFKKSNIDAMMAVTDYIDDEKPLYVATTDNMRITGFHDTPTDSAKYISGGIYGLKESALETLEHCISSGQARMRNFQRQLVADGLKLQAYPFGKIIDIDHAEDIAKAEELITRK